MTQPTRYKVLVRAVRDGEVEAEVGDTVYELLGFDGGIASQDTKLLGETHISVTTDPSGDGSSFTIPLRHLQIDR